ncbi:MAG: GNAT family N-acetyltransferase [Rhodospirillaceae bacterium]|nr:GNAT family N-acetyltransferase [Rhodospirillales bacterium]
MRVEIAWDRLDRAGWEKLFADAGRSALLQSWAYGEAKAELEGWHPRRAIISLDGHPVALAQVLEKRLGGVVRVGRLNRGPVWLRAVSDDEVRLVLAALRAKWRCWRLGALFLAPELPLGRAALMAGFRPRKAPLWCSAWLDLSVDGASLRKRLDGKWRNMLAGAEKAGLAVEVSIHGPALDWLMERYRALMADKSFTGTPPAMIDALARHAPDDVLVLRALAEGEAVAGILLVRHGASATYLVGWNGDAGRRLKANNFLLWQAVETLQRQGCRWFDLGGIDDVLTPGIAAFKRGMKGEEYTLAGEFLGL